jgi:hypothetical protein
MPKQFNLVSRKYAEGPGRRSLDLRQEKPLGVLGVDQVLVPLKVQIIESGMSQRRIAWDAGLSESRFSDIVRGWGRAKDWERASIAQVLGVAESQIFPQSEILQSQEQAHQRA